MIEKIKNNWKNILLAILVIFSLNKCTQSCNRENRINELESTAEYQDSAIISYKSQISKLTSDTAQYIKELKVYKGFSETMASNIAKQNEIAEQNAQNNAKLIKKLNIQKH